MELLRRIDPRGLNQRQLRSATHLTHLRFAISVRKYGERKQIDALLHVISPDGNQEIRFAEAVREEPNPKTNKILVSMTAAEDGYALIPKTTSEIEVSFKSWSSGQKLETAWKNKEGEFTLGEGGSAEPEYWRVEPEFPAKVCAYVLMATKMNNPKAWDLAHEGANRLWSSSDEQQLRTTSSTF